MNNKTKYSDPLPLDPIMYILNKLCYDDQVDIVDFFMKLDNKEEEFNGYPDYVTEFFEKDEEVFQLTIVIDDDGEYELEFRKYDEEE